MSTTPSRQATFLGHPIGLYVLFFTEMWERFSYYGMRALLMLYMVNYFRWEQKEASTYYKVYTSFVYVTPIIGGFLADRLLGNRWAVIIGAVLMTIGHFLMAFEEFPIFMGALIFLILGNGMFKPNMSTQVGRLYPRNDGRLDAAYTIFYMGINLGAFLSPIACGWLADNTQGGYHSGFTMAGIGMMLGLLIYVLGQPLLKEIPSDQQASDVTTSKSTGPVPMTEAEAEGTPSALGWFSPLVTPALLGFAVLLLIAAPVYYFRTDPEDRSSALWDAVMLGIASVSVALIALVCATVRNGVRDRVLTILIIGVFVIFFWGAYEQAGNVLNLWADKHTDRFMTRAAEPPAFESELAPLSIAEGGEKLPVGVLERFRTMFLPKSDPNAPTLTWREWLSKNFNPVPAAWFQSINALAIFVIAPLFAWLWVWLDRRNLQPSIPMKMGLGLVLMSLSVVVMIQAARQEDKVTTAAYRGELPEGIAEKDGQVGFTNSKKQFEPFQAGRLRRDGDTLTVLGVLPDNEYERMVAQTAPEPFRAKLKELTEAAKAIDGEKVKSVSVVLEAAPNDFAKRMDAETARLAKDRKSPAIQYDLQTRTLTSYVPIKEKEDLALRFYAGDRGFAASARYLFAESGTFRVSSWWLFWSYVIATLGELCLSPVGLSMVSKLAPSRSSTMLMGVWMLTSTFGNFAAGAAGEMWGTVPPVTFFTWLAGIVAVAAVVLLVIVRPLVKMMHGVK